MFFISSLNQYKNSVHRSLDTGDARGSARGGCPDAGGAMGRRCRGCPDAGDGMGRQRRCRHLRHGAAAHHLRLPGVHRSRSGGGAPSRRCGLASDEGGGRCTARAAAGPTSEARCNRGFGAKFRGRSKPGLRSELR
jgi:hypothetical protein